MGKHAKIYIAGHTGLVGDAIVLKLKAEGFVNIVTKTHSELDLTKQTEVQEFFESETPQCVVLAAAKVGGIQANISYPADFIYENLAIQTNVIHSSYRFGVKKLLFFAGACVYPRDCPQPMKEEYLLSGYLEPTNEPYAVAKIAGIEMCQAYNRQHGTNFICTIATTIYGPNDSFNLDGSHVIPALIRKFHEAKTENCAAVEVWGTGNPRREFIYVDDVADASLFLLESRNAPEIVNLGLGEDVSVNELAHLIKEVVGYEGDIVFDTSKPDGMPRKALDVSTLKNLGWQAKVSLHEGLLKTYDWYLRQLMANSG